MFTYCCFISLNLTKCHLLVRSCWEMLLFRVGSIIQIKETEKTIVEKTIVYYKATLDGKIVVVSSEAEATFTKETITTTTIPVKYKSTVCEGGEDTPCTPTQWVEVED